MGPKHSAKHSFQHKYWTNFSTQHFIQEELKPENEAMDFVQRIYAKNVVSFIGAKNITFS